MRFDKEKQECLDCGIWLMNGAEKYHTEQECFMIRLRKFQDEKFIEDMMAKREINSLLKGCYC